MTKDSRHSDAEPVLVPFQPAKGTLETTEQLRIAIDRGLTGDKVDAADPAAAPLGTDDEAGGASNTSEQVRLAASYELRQRPMQKAQRTSGLGHAWWLVGFALVFLALILIGCYWVGLL
jgi:hypothetical protein